jgi:pSer/pThr/pTyr-binding forkhead associated (FHA) protein
MTREDDVRKLSDILCILHPLTSIAYVAAALVGSTSPQHMWQEEAWAARPTDLIARAANFGPIALTVTEFGLASAVDMLTVLEQSTESLLRNPGPYDIALRFSARVNDITSGFRFGRSVGSDIRVGTSDWISNNHFCVYVDRAGALMIRDVSSNGTTVDNTFLSSRKRTRTEHPLRNGSTISIISGRAEIVTFLVLLPRRDEALYQENLQGYLQRVAFNSTHCSEKVPSEEHAVDNAWSSCSEACSIKSSRRQDSENELESVSVKEPMNKGIVRMKRKNGDMSRKSKKQRKMSPVRLELNEGVTRSISNLEPWTEQGWQNDCNEDTCFIKSYSGIDAAPYRWVSGPEGTGGRGATGLVLKAIAIPTKEEVAIKAIKFVDCDKARQSVLKEVGLLRKCSHPNILQLEQAFQVADDMSTYYLVTRPWAPITLFQFIVATDGGRGRLCEWYHQDDHESERMVYRILDGIGDGVTYLHQNSIRHKDLKPENILLHQRRDKNKGWIVDPIIADLGHSKIVNPLTSTDFTQSTRLYLAPEQISHKESTQKADIFALGCCFALVLAVICEGERGITRIDGIFDEVTSNGHLRAGTYAEELPRFLEVLDDLVRGWREHNIQRRKVHALVARMLEEEPSNRPDIKDAYRRLHEVFAGDIPPGASRDRGATPRRRMANVDEGMEDPGGILI